MKKLNATLCTAAAMLLFIGCSPDNGGGNSTGKSAQEVLTEMETAKALFRKATTGENGTLTVEFGTGLSTKIETLSDVTLTDNHDGTMTLKAEGKSFSFERAATATHLEITSTAMEGIVAGGTGTITFTAAPSGSWIPTTGDGDMTKYSLIGLGVTRADSPISSENFQIESVEKVSEGVYTAHVKCLLADMGSNYQLQLDLNAGATAIPALISSPQFSIGITVPRGTITFKTTLQDDFELLVAGEGSATIDWGDGSAIETITLHPLKNEEEVNYETSKYVHYYENADSKTVTVNGAVTGIDLAYSEVTAIDLKQMSGLMLVSILDEPEITAIDLSANSELVALNLNSCTGLTSLNISACPKLKVVNLNASEGITALDVSNLTKLTYLSIMRLPITSLNLTNSPELTDLFADQCRLTAIDVTKNTRLRNIALSNNNLTALDVTQCTELESLSFSDYEFYDGDNTIAALDVTKCPNLTVLSCASNKLAALDLSKNIDKLTMLIINDNLLPANTLVGYLNGLAKRDGSTIYHGSPGMVRMRNNPGATGTEYDTAVAAAQAKGWSVN